VRLPLIRVCRAAFTYRPQHAPPHIPVCLWGYVCALQAGQGRSYKYLLPSVAPLYEFASGLSYTRFNLSIVTPGIITLGAVPSEVCVRVQNLGSVSSPVVVTVFSISHTLTLGPRLVPNRKFIAFDKVALDPTDHVTVSQRLPCVHGTSWLVGTVNWVGGISPGLCAASRCDTIARFASM
jgi:hypothetical protein